MHDSQQPDSPHRGWYSRGYIPHFDSPGVLQCVTYRLVDALPASALERLKQELLSLPPERRDARERARVDALLDAGHGSCVLAKPAAAKLVQDAFIYHQGQRYDLLAWVIMPNHVHVLFGPYEEIALETIVGTWRKYTGRRLAPMMPTAQVLPNGHRRVWQRGYWDRYIRDQEHYERVLYYIGQNPVKAGLAARPEDWPWSSAGYMKDWQG